MTPFIVTFYSYKGGVGRTLLAANVAVVLARRAKTLLWDLDIEAPGLHRIPDLAPERQPAAGFFEWLCAWQDSGVEPADADHAALRKSLRRARIASDLYTLQAHGEKADFVGLYQQIRWDDFLVTHPERGLKLFRGALAAFAQDGFRYVVRDSRTGMTDIGGMLTAILPHATVLVGNYGAQNTRGLAHVWRALARAAEGRIAVRDPLPPLQRLLVGSPIPQGQVELAAEGRRVWQQAFEGLPTQMVEVPFDGLLFSETLLAARGGEDSPVTRAYRAITDALTEIESELRAAAEAPTKHLDAVNGIRESAGPTRAVRGERFEDRTAGLLSLLGYSVEREHLVRSNQVDLVVQSRVVDQLFLVECKDHQGEIRKKALEVFQTWIVQARRDHPSVQRL